MTSANMLLRTLLISHASQILCLNIWNILEKHCITNKMSVKCVNSYLPLLNKIRFCSEAHITTLSCLYNKLLNTVQLYIKYNILNSIKAVEM